MCNPCLSCCDHCCNCRHSWNFGGRCSGRSALGRRQGRSQRVGGTRTTSAHRHYTFAHYTQRMPEQIEPVSREISATCWARVARVLAIVGPLSARAGRLRAHQLGSCFMPPQPATRASMSPCSRTGQEHKEAAVETRKKHSQRNALTGCPQSRMTAPPPTFHRNTDTPFVAAALSMRVQQNQNTDPKPSSPHASRATRVPHRSWHHPARYRT
jgi:hypothetical protein